MFVFLCDGYNRLLGTIHKSLQDLLKGMVVAFVSVLFLCDRYNRLLGTIHKSLQDLLKALKGLVVMSQELENMANSLYNNTVPSIWAGKVGGASIQRPELPAAATPTIFTLTQELGVGWGVGVGGNSSGGVIHAWFNCLGDEIRIGSVQVEEEEEA